MSNFKNKSTKKTTSNSQIRRFVAGALIAFCIIGSFLQNGLPDIHDILNISQPSGTVQHQTPDGVPGYSKEPIYEHPSSGSSAQTHIKEDAAGPEDWYATIPPYDGESSFAVVNENVPFFQESDYTTKAFENYSELDAKNRCGQAFANVCQEIMPTEKRGDISKVKPSGWHNKPYDFVDGRYIYNRCHVIGFQLAGENANEKNLITGTRYMNVEGMLPFENMVADYVKETNHHVLYRVTPIFEGDELVARGVLMEAYSVEDNGEGVCFNVFCYNVQPGVTIDYATGDNWEAN